MSDERRDPRRLLRWYPAAWRDRYGDELLALLDDELGEGATSRRSRAAVARAGLRERARATQLFGRPADPAAGRRAGSLLVLATWSLFLLGGLAFQRTSEHFAQHVPMTALALSTDAFDVVVLFAALSALMVVLGAIVTVPALAAFLRDGGWTFVRRAVVRSSVASVVATGALAGLATWAHHLNALQRNGGDGAYTAAFVGLAILVASALASWSATAVAFVSRLRLSDAILRLEGVLALLVTACMAAITLATGLWWNEVNLRAPWFFTGAAPGTSSTGVSENMVVTMVIMTSAVLVAAYGALRVIRSSGGARFTAP